MSVQYAEIIMPGPEAMLFRPSAEQVQQIVDRLLALSWISKSESGESDDDLYINPSAVPDHLRTVPADKPYSLWLAGTGDASVEWPEDDGCFLPDHCEDVKIIYGTRLATPQSDDGTMECPGCGEDLYPQLSATTQELCGGDDAPEDLRFIDSESLYPAPDRCTSCAATIDLRHVSVLIGTDERGVEEEAPFSSFMIKLQAVVPPPMGQAYLDPELLESLSNICGVALRSVGRWS